MKVWPIDPLVPRNLRLEVPEKLQNKVTFLLKQYSNDMFRCYTFRVLAFSFYKVISAALLLSSQITRGWALIN